MTVATLPAFLTDIRAGRADRMAALCAAIDHRAAFERLDGMARDLREEGWHDGAEIVQAKAEIAYRAARADRYEMADR